MRIGTPQTPVGSPRAAASKGCRVDLAVSLDGSKSSRQCSLSYLLTYLLLPWALWTMCKLILGAYLLFYILLTYRGVQGNENRKNDGLTAVCDIKSIHE